MDREPAMKPRLLLVEDDPTSQAFLATAAKMLPAEVDVAGSVAAALRLAGDGHDLWLIDANLPDGSGPGLLAQLRDRHGDVPALAHTASRDGADRVALLAAGFRAVVVKPIAAGAFREALRSVLEGSPGAAARASTVASGRIGEPAPQAWNDAGALAALNGRQAHVDALRGLFLSELPAIRDAVAGAASDGREQELHAMLHRLRASCGFVGAAALGAAVEALRQATDSPAALRRFREAADALLRSA